MPLFLRLKEEYNFLFQSIQQKFLYFIIKKCPLDAEGDWEQVIFKGSSLSFSQKSALMLCFFRRFFHIMKLFRGTPLYGFIHFLVGFCKNIG